MTKPRNRAHASAYNLGRSIILTIDSLEHNVAVQLSEAAARNLYTSLGQTLQEYSVRKEEEKG